MKVLFVVLIVAAVSQAVKIDWDNFKELEINAVLPSLRYGNGRVVGGEEATPHQFPYQAGLIMTMPDGRQAFCGGSLISADSVLTAAHCADGMTSIEVIVGAHRVRDNEETQQRRTSTEFIVHPNWNPLFLTGDIAIVKLPQPVDLNDFVKVVNLPSSSDVDNTFTDKIATVSGWGKETDGSISTSDVLRFTSNNVLSNFQCSISYPFIIRSSHLCVSGKGGKSSCNGDSGGPLTVTVDGVVKQVGLVSFGRASGCERGNPAVYTRLTSYIDWIQNNV